MKLSKGDYLAFIFVIRAIEEKMARDFIPFKNALSHLGQKIIKVFASRISGILFRLRSKVNLKQSEEQLFSDIEKFIEISKPYTENKPLE